MGKEAGEAQESSSDVGDESSSSSPSNEEQQEEEEGYVYVRTSTLEAVNKILEEAFAHAREIIEQEDVGQDVIDLLLQQATANYIPPVDPLRYADRHVQAANAIADNPDCMVREFNIQDPEYDFQGVSEVFDKCRLVVLRNVLDPKMVSEGLKPKLSKYLHALKVKTVNHRGRAQFDRYHQTKHYSLMLPSQLSMPGLIDNENLLKVLQEPYILDKSLRLQSMSAFVNEPGSAPQEWHDQSSNYILDSLHSMEDFGIGGHDLPAYSVNLISPLVDMKYDHGPTEFCVGTSLTAGLLSGQWDSLRPIDESSTFQQLFDFHRSLRTTDDYEYDVPCPLANIRSILLNVGDIVLFDSQMVHREGPNMSSETRASLYLTYARNWYQDESSSFLAASRRDTDHQQYDRLIQNTQFAPRVPDDVFQHVLVGTPSSKPNVTVPVLISSSYVPPPVIDSLEYVRDIFHQLSLGRYGSLEFVISNLDLEEGSTIVSIDEQDPQPLPTGHSDWEAEEGNTMTLTYTTASQEVYQRTWVIPCFMTQLVVSREILKSGSIAPTCVASSDEDPSRCGSESKADDSF